MKCRLKFIFTISTTRMRNASNINKFLKPKIQLLFAVFRHPLAYYNAKNEKKSVAESGLFEPAYYLARNEDLSGVSNHLLTHYLILGWKEGRNPHPLFDTNYYVESNPDVKDARVNPLIHYLRYGWKEGRNPHPLFDTLYYLDNNPDVKIAGYNPLVHFTRYGWNEGRKPFANFNIHKTLSHQAQNENSFDHSFFYSSKNNKNENSGKHNFQYGAVTTPIIKYKPEPSFVQKSSIVVVFHLYHVELADECIEFLKNIPFKFHTIITTSLDQKDDSIKKVIDNFDDVEIVKCKNRGRDIGAFIKVWHIVKQYDICCKIHTKKGDSNYIELWRQLCLNGILRSKELVEAIVSRFDNDNSLALAGPELLYGSFKDLIGINEPNIQFLTEEYSIPVNDSENNGFFMGTMFWMRPDCFDFISRLNDLKFPPETGKNEGGYEHAIERMIGSRALDKNQRVLLTRNNEANIVSYKIVGCDYQPKVTTFHKHFDSIVNSLQSFNLINGYIEAGNEYESEVEGWLALVGNETPREAIVHFDNNFQTDVVGNIYREDLKLNGINNGEHVFHLNFPFGLMDGLDHPVHLIDKLSGKVVQLASITKKRLSNIYIRRTFLGWDTFREQNFKNILDKIRSKNENNFRGLVTVIMPTYNRATMIEKAISSVVSQTYFNFELIIVDDASNDNTENILHKYHDDQRIKYIKQEKGGLSKARNRGLIKSKGEFIFYLDTDNQWTDNFLQTMVDYLTIFKLDSVYCGLVVVNEEDQFMYYRGCDFSWPDINHLNYIDMNSFGHKRLPANETICFDEGLKRWVDWDFILRFASRKTISYAPFLGVKYQGGNIQRISNSVYTNGDELNNILHSIRSSHSGYERPFSDSDYIFETLIEDIVNEPLEEQISVDTFIPSYNHAHFLKKTIESVLNQRGNIAHRVIVSDDGSSDNSRSIVTRYKNQYPDKIIDLSANENQGISKNFRKCIDACTAGYIAICEGDDYWTDRYKLHKQIKFLEENPDCSMVFSKIEVHDLKTNSIQFLNRQEALSKDKLDGDDFLSHPTMNLIANFSCCLFRASLLKSLPKIVFEGRINEIAVVFHLEKFGKIGYINQVMSVYQQHDQGLWTGSDQISQLKSGIETRKMVKEVAQSRYKERIQQIIDEQYINQLKNLGINDL